MTGLFKTQFSAGRGLDFLRRWARLWCLFILLGGGMISADAGQVKKVIHQYALTSANDFPQRDPQDWRLLGSNDGGKTWTTLDVRTGEVFQNRQQRKLYQINNETEFEIYRLQIDKTRDPDSANSVQLAEIELMGRTENDLGPLPIFTDFVCAQGDNPPAEKVSNLFDGHVETKWLDWSSNNVTRASWIQWQYLAPSGTVLTNISQLLALHARAGDGYRVEIKAVVAGRTTEKRMCFVDATGCIELGDIAGAETLGISQTVLITGVSEWNHRQVELKDGRARVLGSVITNNPSRIALEQPLPQGENLKWVQVEGNIQYRLSTKNEFSFDLQDDALNMRVHLRCSDQAHPLPPSGTRVLVRGICSGAFNEQGQWVAANLWAVGWDSLTLLNPQSHNELSVATPMQTGQAAASSTNFNSIEQARQLAKDQTLNHPHVKIRGIVTGLLGGFIQDGTGGIEVIFPFNESRKLTSLGTFIEVDGTAGPGDDGNPIINADHLTILGQGKLPEPQRLSLNQLISGRFDAQWIELEGMVRSTDGSHLLIICDGREFMATLGVAAADTVNQLVDAEVRVRGVGVTAMDEQGRVQGIHLLIPSLEHVDVTEPPRDPKTLPVRTIGSLLGLNGPRESFHRVKVEGVVTLQENQRVFIQDDTGSVMAILKENIELNAKFGRSRWLYWQTPQSKALSEADEVFYPGERVQVIGFPETHRYSPVLTEVTLTKLGVQQSLKPVEITADGIEEGGLDSSLVTFDGMLRGQTTIGDNLVLALEWQDRTLQVFVPGKDSDSFAVPIGSRLRVTGVCQLDPAPYPELGLEVGAVRILTRSEDDLIVLAQPSWWTVPRALMLMGGMTFVTLAALIWIRELRRQVGERTLQLSEQIQLRERTERRHDLEQERARIAKDLHDDLGANLTQIIFLSERVEVARHDGQEVARWFDLIPATARRTIQSLDEIVWAINPKNDSLESLSNYLSQFAQEHLTLARVRCVLDVPMVLPSVPLSAEIRHNLLLTVREALQNAVAHAAATEVRLTLKFNDDGVNIIIADNGKGFDPAATSNGNGLRNMRHRLQSIGGRLEISSQPGRGTMVSLFVPHRLLHARVVDRRPDTGQKS